MSPATHPPRARDEVRMQRDRDLGVARVHGAGSSVRVEHDGHGLAEPPAIGARVVDLRDGAGRARAVGAAATPAEHVELAVVRAERDFLQVAWAERGPAGVSTPGLGRRSPAR